MIDNKSFVSEKSELNSEEKNESKNSLKLHKTRISIPFQNSKFKPKNDSMFPILEE